MLLCLVMTVSIFSGCGKNNQQGNENNNQIADNGNNNQGNTQGNNQTVRGSVYYLSFKPEVDRVWKDLAAAYTQETGVPVKVVTAASNTY